MGAGSPWLPSKPQPVLPRLDEPKGGTRTEAVMSDFKPLGLVRMLMGMGKGWGAEGGSQRAGVFVCSC